MIYTYQFGSDEYEYEPTHEDVRKFIQEVLEQPNLVEEIVFEYFYPDQAFLDDLHDAGYDEHSLSRLVDDPDGKQFIYDWFYNIDDDFILEYLEEDSEEYFESSAYEDYQEYLDSHDPYFYNGVNPNEFHWGVIGYV